MSDTEFAYWDSYARFARHVRFASRYVLGADERAFLETVLATIRNRDSELRLGHTLYRAQRGVEWIDRTDEEGNWIGEDVWGFGTSRMKPLPDRAREGRANPTGIPVLYVGTTVLTAVSEVRPWVGAEVSVAVKLLQRHETTGSVVPGKMGGHRKRVLEPHRAFIEARIRETPHLTLHGLKDELAGRGVKVSHNAVWLFLRREGLSFKKKRCSPLSRRALISPAGASDGDPGRPASIRSAWSSSMKRGSRPTWLRCEVGG